MATDVRRYPHETGSPVVVPFGSKCRDIFARIFDGTLQPRARRRIVDFYRDEVSIPMIVGSPYPGKMNPDLMPQFGTLLDRIYSPRVRFFDLCKGARIGGTLYFGIGPVLFNIAEQGMPALWIDPTRKTATRLSRQEIEPYMRECSAVMRRAILSRTHWTALEKIFTTCTFGMVGAGSVADLGGRQAGLIIINEQDKIPPKGKAEAPPKQLAIVRAKQFRNTCKIFGNSTPTLESGLTWGDFLAGSQLYCYVPCPECGKKQRLTFFPEEGNPDRWIRADVAPEGPDREVFDEIKPAPDGRGWLLKGVPPTGRFWWPPNLKDRRTKAWDVDAVERATLYECAFCAARFDQRKLKAMLRRHEWRAHNPAAPDDHETAQHWGAYSVFETWGYFAKKWLLSQGAAHRLHDFWNSDLGLPWIPIATRVTKKTIELIQAQSPPYDRQNPQEADAKLVLPIRPVVITIHVDVQQTEFWWTMRAWAADGARYLLAWGSCVGFPELVDLSNRIWRYDHGLEVPAAARFEEFSTFLGIMDTGYKAKRPGGVYRFIHEQGGRWQGSKGGSFQGKEKPIHESLVDFNYDGRVVSIPVIHYNDFILKEHLYRFVLKERKPPGYFLPRQIDDTLADQLTAEHLRKTKLPDGRTADEWHCEIDPHLGDCEKEAEVLGFILTPDVLGKIREKQDAARARLLEC
jgi:phage terminase large subunit GpA-like protein